jgi:hypothetical protein
MTNRTYAYLLQVVRLGRTRLLISFSRNAASYCSRPRLQSQPPRSMAAPTFCPVHDHPGDTACLGYAPYAAAQVA